MTIKFEENFKRKELIEELVKLYRKQYPDEDRAIIVSCKEIRKSRKNIYASDNRKDPDAMRWTLRVPRKLDILVNNFLNLEAEPRFLSEQKEVIWFAKRFPEYKIAEKI